MEILYNKQTDKQGMESTKKMAQQGQRNSESNIRKRQ